jgi:hypothetical protein
MGLHASFANVTLTCSVDDDEIVGDSSSGACFSMYIAVVTSQTVSLGLLAVLKSDMSVDVIRSREDDAWAW